MLRILGFSLLSLCPSAILAQGFTSAEVLERTACQRVLDRAADTFLNARKGSLAFLQSETNPKPKENDRKLKILLISGSLEYKSDESLADLQKHLEAHYPIECSRAFRNTDDDLPGLEALDSCDVALFFTRRLTIKGEQLERIKKYAKSGKPIVAIRTASHGFQNWLEMDKEVFGGDYSNHYKAGIKCEVEITDAATSHPILVGVKPFISEGSLYRNANVSKDASILLTGTIPEHREPIAWVREYEGGRVFYTSLGHPSDFKTDSFVRMITNAIFWTSKRDFPPIKDAK